VRIFFHYQVTDAPWGGGNQFLRGLIEQFHAQGALTRVEKEAQIHFFNSHQNYREVIRAARVYRDATFIQRVDGPMRLYNHRRDPRDLIVFLLARFIADGVIFQSDWSKRRSLELGFTADKRIETEVIHNSADDRIFFPDEREQPQSQRLKIIIVSWSTNQKKGFGIYKWLDKNLDFGKYLVDFVGNSPTGFQNIRVISPLSSEELARKMRESDMLLTASINDPCSNVIVEALACGTPVLALASGGHPELINSGGMLFSGRDDLLEKIDQMALNLDFLRQNIRTNSMKRVSESYLRFCRDTRKKLVNSKSNRSKLILFLLPLLLRLVLIRSAVLARLLRLTT
jgi:glycosyltransferase involved in cell wall biosynthesis